MYSNPQFKQIDRLVLPGEGEAFDVKKFQESNGLDEPEAGVGMGVKLGGTADWSTGGAGGGTSASSRASPTIASSSGIGIGNGTVSASTGAPSTPRSSRLVVASSVSETQAAEPSTITSTVVLNSGTSVGTSTPTVSGGVAPQSTGAASGLRTVDCVAMAPFLVVAGVWLW